jgi:hypothetical protein
VLLERDKSSFSGLWGLTSLTNKINYVTELPENIPSNSVIIVDEADLLIFANPKLF